MAWGDLKAVEADAVREAEPVPLAADAVVEDVEVTGAVLKVPVTAGVDDAGAERA